MGAQQFNAAQLVPAHIRAGALVASPYSLQFSGSPHSVAIPNLPLNPNMDFTIEAYVKLTSNTTNNVIYAGALDTNNYWMLIARNDANGLCFQAAYNSPSATFVGGSAATVTVAEGWVHVAVTRAGNLYSFYKNGVFLKSATQAGNLTGGSSQAIARLPSPFTVYFLGLIHDLRLWSYARSAAELLANMQAQILPRTPGLAGNWKATASSMMMLPDYSGFGNNGQIVAATISTDKPF